MNKKEEFINSGFQVMETISDNKLLNFLIENYPTIIRDNEININELKALTGLPVDEKVNGYGLNFVGRNVARAKYAQKTEKEVRINKTLSKNFDTTQNLVLKGDNLESLKILKSHYIEKIKCIYIDPPYNTTSDQFVYPDKFDKEETEVLGMYNLSEDEFARMDFSFKSKKSHSGWLAFMYPRLLLARDLMSKDGVIFISIDDNEQANLKLLCDDVFGEENFVADLPTIMNLKGNNDEFAFAGTHEYTLVYCKNNEQAKFYEFPIDEETMLEKWEEDEIGYFKKGAPMRATGSEDKREDRPEMFYPFLLKEDEITVLEGDEFSKIYDKGLKFFDDNFLNQLKSKYEKLGYSFILPISNGDYGRWRWGYSVKNKVRLKFDVIINKSGGEVTLYKKQRPELGELPTKKPKSIFYKPEYSSGNGTQQIKDLLGEKLFTNPKPLNLIQDILQISIDKNSTILDFFAGSGTTGQAVMQLNAEDGGNRKFILCQIDEPISKDKPAHKFCIENNLPPVISSITIERLKRAGEKIAKQIEEENNKTGLFDENKKQIPDVGFKVFDSTEAPKLEMEAGKIVFPETNIDSLSRIYNMIFTVGLDEPTQAPETVIEDAIYKIGTNYYITNSEKVSSTDFSNAIKNGKVFIDGWTASLNATLQHYKDDVKIIF